MGIGQRTGGANLGPNEDEVIPVDPAEGLDRPIPCWRRGVLALHNIPLLASPCEGGTTTVSHSLLCPELVDPLQP
ncbi:hypothetical protein PISMIDRAFT_201733 [Pisolithus microcarpus 441]|uniref:Uncharacterized protein n=1 Tax=Pisolithus microcarpus 441 TaxID=765257 RepID=A0A0C9ZMR8_9AGAM|nr:hypothetical protein PISMIDRAFT_201733 [Pisolithus microcarpus 441]